MEFLPGGDLMSLLMKEDTFSEAATKQVRVLAVAPLKYPRHPLVTVDCWTHFY